MISDISAGAASTTVEEVLAATRSGCSDQAVLCLILRPQRPLGPNGFTPVQGENGHICVTGRAIAMWSCVQGCGTQHVMLDLMLDCMNTWVI